MAYKQYGFSGSDDTPLVKTRRDLSGGQNTRQYGNIIKENQAILLQNVDIGVPGERARRPGSVTIGSAVEASQTVTQLGNFIIQGATDQLLAYCNKVVYKSEEEGAWASLVAAGYLTVTPGFIFGKESGLSPDDVVLISDGTNNCIRIDYAGNLQDLGDTNTSPPLSKVGVWYGNRFWFLKNDLLAFSDAYDADYSGAFDRTTNVYRIPVGEERAILATRDLGMVIAGKDGIWGLAPSATPVATDTPEPLTPDIGIVSNNAMVAAADDIYFFATDGLRALKRTVQDKLQAGVSYPISYQLKDEYEDIAWDYIDRLCMTYFDNKVFISVPVSATSMTTWIYYPASNGFVVATGQVPRAFTKHKVDGQLRMYYSSYGDGKIHREWYGYTDEGSTTTNGTNIAYSERGRKEDLDQPLLYKSGGEIEVRVPAVGNYDLTVYAQFDDGGWNQIGTINTSGNLVTFPVTFPVTFTESNIVTTKFHLDAYGRWRHCQVRIDYDGASDDNIIKVLEHSIVSFPEQYQSQ